MTVLFVLLTFGFFLALDAWSHRNEMVPAAAASLPETEAFRFEPVWVAGFQVPDGLPLPPRPHLGAARSAPIWPSSASTISPAS